MGIRFEDRFEHFGNMAPQVLFALARNESAIREYRKCAVEILLYEKHKLAEHPDLAQFVAELKAQTPAVIHESEVAEKEEVAPVVAQKEEAGPFKASVTTATLHADDVIETADKK